MSNKLTKNDRLNDCHSVPGKTCTRKKNDLRNVTKAFEMILTKNEAREIFFDNWATQNLLFADGSLFKMWKKTRRCYHYGNWVSKAFVWSRTKEGYEFWKKVNTDWEKWVGQYIIGYNENGCN